MEQVILLVVFSFVFMLVYYIFSGRQKKYSRLEVHEVTKEKRPAIEIKESERKTPAGLRGVLARISPLIRKIVVEKPKAGLSRDLVTAGKPFSVVEFYALKFTTTGIGFVLALVFMKIVSEKPNPMIPFIGIFFGFYLPSLLLKRKVRKRQQDIAKELPSVIDLLNLCVSSGVDFMLGVQRVIKDYKPCPLTEELSILWQENNMGVPRKEALKGLSWRVNLPEMSSFISTLVQADKMGTPISDALEIQAEQLRIRRFQRGEENALKAPIKLLIPLIFFILPVVAIIVAAPIVLQFLKGGVKF